ncbi:LuxR C-terminal-related transcriptional regulator [Micromonospora sp. NPDC093277]|uniref:helix-turn-helix transcriptional regulator n=1 Tax=Micromonospora sp. NPDC093277 TaxID=3364291 RepID=UPI0037F71E87
MKVVDVILGATDPVTKAGAVACLSAYPQIRLRDPATPGRADVLLVIADDVTTATIDLMRRNRAAGGPRSVVLVAAHIHRDRLIAAAQLGLMALLPRARSGFDAIVAAIVAACAGCGRLPDAVLGLLLKEMSAQPATVEPVVPRPEFSAREVRVLELLADGIDTAGVAARLNYSERTVKNIVHAVVRRLDLRNRTHAVAYALRTGAIGASPERPTPVRPVALGAAAGPGRGRTPSRGPTYGRVA